MLCREASSLKDRSNNFSWQGELRFSEVASSGTGVLGLVSRWGSLLVRAQWLLPTPSHACSVSVTWWWNASPLVLRWGAAAFSPSTPSRKASSCFFSCLVFKGGGPNQGRVFAPGVPSPAGMGRGGIVAEIDQASQ